MAANADIFNVFDSLDSETGSKTVRLPDVHGVLVQLAVALKSVQLVAERATEVVEEVELPLRSRIEANRARSERARRNGHAATNGHAADIALKLTNHGLVAECRKCGKRVVA